jgi:hypothetical protein
VTLKDNSSQINDLIKQVRDAHAAVLAAKSAALESERLTLASALAAGTALIEIRGLIVGTMKAWVRKNLSSVGYSTAKLYMQLANNRAVIDAAREQNPHLSIRAARRLIAKQKKLANPEPEPLGVDEVTAAAPAITDAELVAAVGMLRGFDPEDLPAEPILEPGAPGGWHIVDQPIRPALDQRSGNGVQPQNLKHPEVEDIEAAIAAVSTGSYPHVRSLYPKPLAVIGDLSRSMICAAPGHKLIGADLSSIESRVLAWIADENWKLDSYRRYDATHDPRDEPYCITACKIFRVSDGTFNAESPERGTGKTCDLAFGFQGGLNAWRIFEPNRFTDSEVEQFKLDWRAAHPNIKKFWYAIDRATWEAVKRREQVIRCGRLLLKCSGAYLFIKLPSGRKLAYPYPRIEIEDLQHEVVVFRDASGGRWRDCRGGNGAYGGLWTENVVSGIARDLLAGAMLRLEQAGYRIVLHVHDEAVAEVPEDFGSIEEFTRLMIASPAWALGLPIAAKAWTGQRFS